MKKSKSKKLESPLPTGAVDGGEDDHEAESFMRTLMEADKIKASPEKLARVKKAAGRHKRAVEGIESLEDLREIYQEKYGAEAKKKKMGVGRE